MEWFTVLPERIQIAIFLFVIAMSMITGVVYGAVRDYQKRDKSQDVDERSVW